jgi:hypothetical protein
MYNVDLNKIVLRLLRWCAFVYLFIDSFGHKMIADVYINAGYVWNFINIVSDVLGYLEAKNRRAKRTC